MSGFDLIVNPPGGGGGTGGGIGGGADNPYFGGGVSNPVDVGDKYYTKKDVAHNKLEDRLHDIANTAKPITVDKVPDEHFTGGADEIISLYGSDLDSVKNPYAPYITGYKTETKTDQATQENYNIYTPTYEYSAAHKEFADALEEAKTKQRAANASHWKISFKLLSPPPPPVPLFQYVTIKKINPQAYVESYIDGSIYDWFAGGGYYDAPRAGGQLFNVTGNLNTLKFLGFSDLNMNSNLRNKLVSRAELFRILHVTAGASEDVASSSPQYKLYQSMASQSSDENFLIPTQEHGQSDLHKKQDYTYHIATCKDVGGDPAFCRIDGGLEEIGNGNIGHGLLEVGGGVLDGIGDRGTTLYKGIGYGVKDLGKVFGW